MKFADASSGPLNRRIKRRRLRSLAFAPTLMTLGNLVCGFAAVHFALRAMYDLGAGVPPPEFHRIPKPISELLLPSFLSIGAGLVILGMVFDLLDGLIARVTRSTTNFGGQLDSLADVVTFGVAPATLMVAFMAQQLSLEAILPSPLSDHFIGRAAWVAAALYVAFVAIRLARFNVEHARADFDHRIFRGLPSPAAACVVVAFILFQDRWGPFGQSVAVYTMPIVAVIISFLMVSRIPYRRFHRAYLMGKRPFSQFIAVLILLAVFWLVKAPTLFLLVMWYAASGPIFLFARRLRSPHPIGSKSDTPLDTSSATLESRKA
jgi:CDP-diacylglycerol--serine O-phosphatidyltransferase